jgi:simple sugar transport system ATP-binding protein
LIRLALHTVRKRFGAVTAVAPVTLALPAGRIHALLGENGAGKSTLVRMIAGVIRPDGGRIELDGRALALGNPCAARAAGVGVVHQHFALVGALSVAENLLLGRTEVARTIVRPASLVREARALADAHGLDIGDPSALCRALPVGALARVEILRALAGTPRVLLLDEPTAVLTPPEIAELFETLRRLRDAGMLILLVTHKIDEVMRVCDGITVLRDGRVVAEHAVTDTSAGAIAAIMVGGAVDGDGPAAAHPAPAAHVPHPRRDETGGTALAVQGIATAPARGRTALAAVTFTMRPGEIRGVAGVDGNGQDELAGALYGTTPRAGTVAVDAVEIAAGSVPAAQQAGIALIPSDRQRDGLALELSVRENALLAAPVLARCTRHGIVDRFQAERIADRLVRDYRVTLESVTQPMAELSGGNQQRVVIGRALAADPRVLIAVNPTRGLDIAATAQVHDTLRRVAAAGTAVLLISTDLDEILALASEVHVLFRGRLSAPRANPERETLGRLMAGLAP